jgi:hypothetical protein
MNTLETLGLALGFATLAGLNLYLTVFATGLAINQHWIDISQTHPDLAILGHPAIIAIAGVLYLLQFFADKVPWVDSLWDAVHTVIRPVGGAFLAIRVLGTPDPMFDVIIALLGGSVSLMAHSVKAGTRLVVNHSPEPFSNIALSLGEDAAVIGGLALMKNDPLLALILFSVVLLAIAYFGPKLWRAVKVNVFLLWRKIASPAADQADTELSAMLPSDLDLALHKANLAGDKLAWAVPCISAAAREIPGNVFGYLIATDAQPATVAFLAKRRWRTIAVPLNLASYKVAHEAKLLSENVVLYSLEKKPKYVFVFDRSQRALVKQITGRLQTHLLALNAGETLQPEAVAA